MNGKRLSNRCALMTLAGMLAWLAAVCVPWARAEKVAEVWRSPFGRPRSVSVRPSDRSCWAATGSSVMHVAANGSVLSQTNGFWNPQCVAADPGDGTCWVADTGNNQVVHLDEGGAEIVRLGGFNRPQALCVNPADRSCWVADTGNDEVVHLSAAGAELVRIGRYEDPSNPAVERCFVEPGSVSVNPTDGSCWVADTGNDQVVHLAEDGTQLLRIGCYEDPAVTPPVERCLTAPGSVAVNPVDGSCWVADTGGNYLVHLADDGSLLWCGPCFSGPQSISVDPTDGSCWVADTGNNHLVHLDADGNQLLRQDRYYDPNPLVPPPITPFVELSSVSVDPTDGSVWVADAGSGCFVHLNGDLVPVYERGAWLLVLADGYERQWGFVQPEALSVDYTDGTCWVADTGDQALVRVTVDTYEMWELSLLLSPLPRRGPRGISVNPTDGTVWVAFSESNVVEHLLLYSPFGSLRSDEFLYPRSVAVDPNSFEELTPLGRVRGWLCWVADTYRGRVARIAEYYYSDWYPFPEPVWYVTFVEHLHTPESVSVNAEDGSCWVADSSGNQVVHLNRDGDELWRKSCFNYPLSVSVNSADASCWIADSMNNEVVHLAENGAGLLRLQGFRFPHSVSADAGDGTCWVADTLNNQVVHVAENGTELWRGGSFSQPYAVCVNPTDGSCWVADTGNDQVVHLVITEGPPRARFTAAPLAGSAPLQVTFTDQSLRNPTSWFWDFGDGTTSDEQHPSHEYVDLGVYEVTLTASNAHGSDSETKPLYITVAFSDLGPDHWACGEILSCARAGIVSGYLDGTYHPEYPVTRDEMAAYISRALAGGDGNVPPDSAYPVPSFTDVPADHWAYNYIEYAASQNVVKGHEDGTYQPDAVVDRGQMAAFVARAMVAPGGDGAVPPGPATPTFPDVPTNYWAYQQVEYVAGQGVVKGYEDGLYHPERQVTRDQMAVYVAKAFKLPL